jgi:hypothetical protein
MMVSAASTIGELIKACIEGNPLVGLQGDEVYLPPWILQVIVWGVLVLFTLGVIIGLLLWIQGRRIRRKAAEAGIDAPLPPSGRDLRPFGIPEGVWVFFGLILIGVVFLVAPIIRAMFPQTAIITAIFLILAGVVWFFVFYGIVYIVREFPRRQRLLEEAIRRKGATAATSKEPQRCSACGQPLQEGEKYCRSCGAAPG